jgi:hypothetical protein
MDRGKTNVTDDVASDPSGAAEAVGLPVGLSVAATLDSIRRRVIVGRVRCNRVALMSPACGLSTDHVVSSRRSQRVNLLAGAVRQIRVVHEFTIPRS